MLKILTVFIILSGPATAAPTQEGTASWYGPNFIGHRTSNGELYTGTQLTAASNSYPMDSFVSVTNPENHRSVVVRINDRGNLKKYHRIIDLSSAAARILDFKQIGIIRVKIHLTHNDE